MGVTMNNRAILATFVILAVAFAGCTAPGQGTQQETDNTFDASYTPNDGLSIDFTSPAREYEAGQEAQFVIRAKNTGEGTAWLKDITLFKAPWLDRDERVVLGTVIQERLEELFETSIGNIDTVVSAEIDEIMNELQYETDAVKLEGVDQANNIDGASTTFQASPRIDVNYDVGQVNTYEVGARIAYDYETNARGTITVLPSDDFREQDPRQLPVSTDTTAGPINVEIRSSTPIPASRDRIPINIEIDNVGDGQLERLGTSGPRHIDRMTLQLEAQGAFVEGCGDNFQQHEITVGDIVDFWEVITSRERLEQVGTSSAADILRDIEGADSSISVEQLAADAFLSLNIVSQRGTNIPVYDGEQSVSCTLNIEDTALDLESDIVVKTQLEYDYIEDKEISIDVRGNQGR